MAFVGIDIGTTNSLIAVWQDGEANLIPNVQDDWGVGRVFQQTGLVKKLQPNQSLY